MQGTRVLSLVWEDPTYHVQLSPFATTTEARTPRAHAPQQEKPRRWEARAPQLESSSHLPQLEKAHVAAMTQCSQK